MTSPIAFVADIDQMEQDEWLVNFAKLMPEISVVPFDALDDLAAVEVAIVANPRPSDLLKLPSLKWIQSLWAGVEGILKEPSLDHIPLVRMTDPNLAATMAEAVLAWTLYLHRDMPGYAQQQKDKVWKQLPFTRAESRTVGILGLGKLGLASAQVLNAAGFKVAGWSRSLKNIKDVDTFAGPDGLSEMLGQTDIAVCLLPQTPETRNLLDADAFISAKAGCSLINFGRGAIIDHDALVAALGCGHFKHAVLDVFREEPLPSDDILWQHPNITILPHISAPTDPITASQLVVSNLRAYLKEGTFPTFVDRTTGY